MELMLDKYVLSSKTKEQVVNSIHDKHLEAWKNFLDALPHLKQSDELLMKTLKVVGLKLADFSGADGEELKSPFRRKQMLVLSLTCSNDMFIECVKGKIIEWSVKEEKKADLEVVLLLLYSFCDSVLKTVPTFGKEFLFNLVCTVAGVVWSSRHVSNIDDATLGGFRSLERKIRKMCEEAEVEKERKRTRGFFSQYEKMLHEHLGEPPEDFRMIQIVPRLEELLRECEFLRPNKVIGAYESADHYLDVQFRLLREDFIQPLRCSVLEFIKNSSTQSGIGRPSKSKQPKENNVRVYKDVVFNRKEASKENGFDHLFTLPPDLVRSVNWDKSKRLLPGCLVMFTQDDCKSGVFAITVAPPFDYKKRGSGDSRRSELSEGILRVYVEGDMGDDMMRGVRYTVFESEAYFEAYKHNLRILQEIQFLGSGSGASPMAKYLVGGSSSVGVPAYLDVQYDPWDISRWNHPDVDTFKLYFNEGEMMDVKFKEPETWDAALIQEKIGLNAYQYDAMKMALTSEIALIQGPPGTGKTFVGLHIVRTLFLNKICSRDGTGGTGMVFGKECGGGGGSRTVGIIPDSPFLVLCYTNHALDQFLELLLHWMPNLGVVRVGGQCKSEKLDRYTLAKIRKEMLANYGEPPNYKRYKIEEGRALRRLRNVEENLSRLRKEVAEMENPDGLFCFSNMTVFEKLKDAVPKNLLDSMRHESFFKFEWWMFSAETFAVEGMLAHEFLLDAEVVRRDLPEVIKRWEESFLKEEKHDGEDFDLDELLENRVVDHEGDEDGEVGDFDILEVYLRDCNVRGLKAREEQRRNIVAGEAVQYQNKRILVSSVLALFKFGCLNLPFIDQRFLIDESVRRRFALYFKVLQVALQCAIELERELLEELEDAKAALETARKRLFSARNEYIKFMEEINASILKQCDIIGMTTTGAAKNHSLLEKAKAKIVIVEEAAEILEAHIVTALTGDCQHLILIGDHLQLRPSTSVYELGRDYRMNVSLFERLILNGVPYCTLKTQHRMRPEISNLIVGPIYEELIDHKSVLLFKPMRGVTKNVFFIDHKEKEDKDSDLMSKSNTHEAQFIAGLCSYLVKQGYKKEQITILTMYAGQMFVLKKLVGRDFASRGVRITCVDSYQGEENDIILLSLVRSNVDNNVGFVGVDNRICVSLSRARIGMYIIGNMDCLQKRSKVWRGVNRKLKHVFSIGNGLELICEKHMKRVVVKTGSDFEQVGGGGCDLICGDEIVCSVCGFKYSCNLACHVDKEQHSKIKCPGVCLKVLGCGHPCKLSGGMCSQACGACKVEVEKVLGCGHKGMIACSRDPSKEACPGSSVKTLPCGHNMEMRCRDPVEGALCEVLFDMKFNPCGHQWKIMCKDLKNAKCMNRCTWRHPCGHICTKSCHWDDDPAHLFYKCTVTCNRVCHKNHPCQGKHLCHERCPPCKVSKRLACGHDQLIPCGGDLRNARCTAVVENCRKRCRAGHFCKGSHPCSGRCPPCKTIVRKKLNCGHEVTMLCHDVQNGRFQCNVRVLKKLVCGHSKNVECCQPNDRVDCFEMVKGECAYCGFKGPVKCGYKLQRKMCRTCMEKGMTDIPSDPRKWASRGRFRY